MMMQMSMVRQRAAVLGHTSRSSRDGAVARSQFGERGIDNAPRFGRAVRGLARL
jgi:hypothetical protein